MSTFNISGLGSSLDSANDLKQVKSYLYKLQDELRYMFNNLTPDDNNASSVPKLVFASNGDKEAKIEVSVDGITYRVGMTEEEVGSMITQSETDIRAEVWDTHGNSRISQNASQIELRVKSSDLGNSSLTITPKRINISSAGQLVINTSNLKLDASGNLSLAGTIETNKEMEVKGTIHVGGSDGGSIVMYRANNSVWGWIDEDGISFGDGAISEDGSMQVNDLTVFGELQSENLQTMSIGCADIYVDDLATADTFYSISADETWSDRRLKENIKDLSLEDSLTVLKELRPVTFNFKKHPDRDAIGMIAQEVMGILESHGINLPLTGNTPDGEYYTIAYSNFIPLLIKAVQYLLNKEQL